MLKLLQRGQKLNKALEKGVGSCGSSVCSCGDIAGNSSSLYSGYLSWFAKSL